jgi:hypothetical protein
MEPALFWKCSTLRAVIPCAPAIPIFARLIDAGLRINPFKEYPHSNRKAGGAIAYVLHADGCTHLTAAGVKILADTGFFLVNHRN